MSPCPALSRYPAISAPFPSIRNRSEALSICPFSTKTLSDRGVHLLLPRLRSVLYEFRNTPYITLSNLLLSEKDLFKDADILKCYHMPDQILFRDAEPEEMAFHIRPGIRGRQLTGLLCPDSPSPGRRPASSLSSPATRWNPAIFGSESIS